MTEPVLCPQCGSEIPAGSPAGLCPKCLVLAGLESQPPADPETPADAGIPSGAAFRLHPSRRRRIGGPISTTGNPRAARPGGHGRVYKARQPQLDRLVAVKILPPGGRRAGLRRAFHPRGPGAGPLSHPNIVAVYDFGRTGDGLFYFVMEYVDGVNLRQAIQAGGMEPKQALAIVPQICDALQFAHDEGIVHRDIKPENILIDKRGRVKIADFGLAKLLGQEPADQPLTGTQQVMGTLRYMAPEQMEGTKAVDHRADIYSLGVVFYELLTGELPIGRFAPPSKKVQIDVRLDEVVLRALEKEPEQRYQHASEVKTDVQSILSGVAPEAGAAGPGPSAAAVGAPQPSGLADAPDRTAAEPHGGVGGDLGCAGDSRWFRARQIQRGRYDTYALDLAARARWRFSILPRLSSRRFSAAWRSPRSNIPAAGSTGCRWRRPICSSTRCCCWRAW